MAYALAQARIATPIGMVRLAATAEALVGITIETDHPDETAPPQTPLLREAATQIGAYFAGDLKRFDLPLTPPRSKRGAALRAAIESIGYGDTQSYGELARRFDSGPRAIGQACARNPFPIVVPCHRVTAAGGALGFYSGGDGTTTKQRLIAHERGHAKGRGE